MAGNSDLVRAYGKSVEVFAGSVTGNGASNAVITTGKASLASCVITATGKYTLTLKDRGAALLGVQLTVGGATGASNAKLARPVTVNSTAKTVTIEVTDLATPSLINLATTDTMYVMVLYARVS